MLLESNLIFSSIAVLLAYLLGSVSSAILLCRLFKLPDPRTDGSKNPGTTNVLRLAGKQAAALVLCGDLAKGLIAVMVAKYLNLSNGLIAIIAVAVFCGHLFPIFFNFNGGKGVATTFGIILGLCWPLALLSVLIWILIFIMFRLSSLAALIATLNAMLLSGLSLYLGLHSWLKREFAMCIIFLGLWIILKHRLNIYNLLHNTESKV